MNIEKIKQIITTNQNKKIDFKFNGNRNQTEEFSGIITNAYKCVFLVKICKTDLIRSFSYTDILIGNLEVKV